MVLCIKYFSLIYLVSAIGSPLCGFLVDRTGRNITWVMAGILATLGCHAMLAFTFVTPYVPMVCLKIYIYKHKNISD